MRIASQDPVPEKSDAVIRIYKCPSCTREMRLTVELYERKAVPVDLNAGRKLLLGLRAVDQNGTHDSRLPNFGATTIASHARSATRNADAYYCGNAVSA
jgi:hypothetical protein